MVEMVLVVAVLVLVVVLPVIQQRLSAQASKVLEQQHRGMLTDLHEGLSKQGERLIST